VRRQFLNLFFLVIIEGGFRRSPPDVSCMGKIVSGLSFLGLLFLVTSTIQAQESRILLLNQNLALIEQKKVIILNKGVNQLNFSSVDEEIILESVYPQLKGCRFLEQKFLPPFTLVWKVESEIKGGAELKITYLTRGISWKINYQMEIDGEGKFLNLFAWLSLENKGGVNWWDTDLAFLRDLIFNRQQEDKKEEKPVVINYHSNMSVTKQKEKLLFFLNKPISLGKNETKTFLLFSLFKMPFEKIYLFDGERYGDVVREELSFTNPFEKTSNFFLPEGTVYIYKTSPEGRKFYLGSEKLAQIPPGGEARIYLGPARGITAQRIQTFYREVQLSPVEKRVYKKEVAREYEYRLVLFNSRSIPVKVKIIEHFYDLWEILESDPPVDEEKKDKIIYQIEIPPQSQKIVKYRAKII